MVRERKDKNVKPAGEDVTEPLGEDEFGKRRREAMEAELAAAGQQRSTSVAPVAPPPEELNLLDFNLDELINTQPVEETISTEFDEAFVKFIGALKFNEDLATQNGHRNYAGLLKNCRQVVEYTHGKSLKGKHATPQVK